MAATTPTHQTRDDFIDLILDDAELLRREFDDLVAAAWSTPPPAAPPPSGSARRRRAGGGQPARARCVPHGRSDAVRPVLERQRSPPARVPGGAFAS
ncbi:hypothetical protein [Luedemannella helvata]|uniref:Uncharacterized protein n=1 Tax=Luedemannella helvata TaxID=349315 RepID=A0ABP4X687_9ACTN